MVTSVVPHAGTWIEIIWRIISRFLHGSFPTRERGLKSFLVLAHKAADVVVPHAGTWIEMEI